MIIYLSSCYTSERLEPTENLIVKPSAFVEINVGENKTLRCEADVGVFKKAPFWTKDRQILKNQPGKMIVMEWVDSKSISELHVLNAKPEDAGLYVCSAVKVRDGLDTRKSIRLTVKGK